MFCRKPEPERNSFSRLSQPPNLSRCPRLLRPPGLPAPAPSCSHVRAHLPWSFGRLAVRDKNCVLPEADPGGISRMVHQQLSSGPPAAPGASKAGPTPRLMSAHFTHREAEAREGGQFPSQVGCMGMPGMEWGLGMRPQRQASLGDLAPVSALSSAGRAGGAWLPHLEGRAVRTRVIGMSAFPMGPRPPPRVSGG